MRAQKLTRIATAVIVHSHGVEACFSPITHITSKQAAPAIIAHALLFLLLFILLSS
jgi:hypothetical protein